MTSYPLAVLIFLGPVLLICAGLWVWSRRSRVPDLARLLRVFAVVCAVILAAVFHLNVLVGATCEGNALYGFTTCSVVPKGLASNALGLMMLAYLAALVATCAIVVTGIVMELRARR